MRAAGCVKERAAEVAPLARKWWAKPTLGAAAEGEGEQQKRRGGRGFGRNEEIGGIEGAGGYDMAVNLGIEMFASFDQYE